MRIRLLAAIPVIFALALAFAIHPATGASHPLRRDQSETMPKTITKPQVDLEGSGYSCSSGANKAQKVDFEVGCQAVQTPNSDFSRCGPDTSGCSEAWVDADGPHNGKQAGVPIQLDAGCGNSFTDDQGVMHFEYATLSTSTNIHGLTSVLANLANIGDNGKDTKALLYTTAAGTSNKEVSGEAYATSVLAKSENANKTNIVTINNGGVSGSEHVVSGGFTITFKGIVDETMGGSYYSGGVMESYLPNGTVSCTIDAANILDGGGPFGGSPDFDAEVEQS